MGQKVYPPQILSKILQDSSLVVLKKNHQRGKKSSTWGNFDFQKSFYSLFHVSTRADFKKSKKIKIRCRIRHLISNSPQIGRVVSSVRATLSTKLQSLISSPVIFTFFTLLILISCNHSFIRSSIILILTL